MKSQFRSLSYSTSYSNHLPTVLDQSGKINIFLCMWQRFASSDFTSFQAHSGWFYFPGFQLGMDGLYHVLAKKADMGYDAFMKTGKAVYILDNYKVRLVANSPERNRQGVTY